MERWRKKTYTSELKCLQKSRRNLGRMELGEVLWRAHRRNFEVMKMGRREVTPTKCKSTL